MTRQAHRQVTCPALIIHSTGDSEWENVAARTWAFVQAHRPEQRADG